MYIHIYTYYICIYICIYMQHELMKTETIHFKKSNEWYTNEFGGRQRKEEITYIIIFYHYNFKCKRNKSKVIIYFLYMFFIYIQNVFHFLSLHSEIPYPILPYSDSMRVLHHPLTPILLSRHSPTLVHWTPSSMRASLPTDVQQGHFLPHMWPAT